MGDDFLNSALICVVDKEKLAKVTNEVAIERFHDMTSCKGHL